MIEHYSRAGSYKFKRGVSVHDLEKIMTILWEKTPHDFWLDLHVRSAGDDGTHYLAFHIIGTINKATSSEMASNAVDTMMREVMSEVLGTKRGRAKGLMGWSVSTVLSSPTIDNFMQLSNR